MNKAILSIISAGLSAVIACGCAALPGGENVTISEPYTVNTSIEEVTSDPAFGNYGRLIFPVDSGYYSGDTLGDLGLVWYNYIDPNKTVEICSYMKGQATAGNQIFYDIYTDEEKGADPDKEDTGLFFFKGEPGAKFAICNAGGGFAYVGAMHDSFPHALELSKKGYNAFALVYRPGAQTACEDLARAIAFIHDHADELEVDTDGYSLWGGSAGARMGQSKSLRTCPTALGWALAQWQRTGWTGRWHFGKDRKNSLAKRVRIVYTLGYKLQRKQAASCTIPNWKPSLPPPTRAASARRRSGCSSRPRR